jgi:hypothetical protein
VRPCTLLILKRPSLCLLACAAAHQVFCPPDCSWEVHRCAPNCIQECPQRLCPKTHKRCIEPNEAFVNRTLHVIWRYSPSPPAEQASTPRLLLVTVTFPHRLQLLKLSHCARVLSSVPNTLWLVAEDSAQTSPKVAELLRRTGKPHRHIAHGPTRKGGNAQREALLQMIKRERLRGVVYNMDDDNGYHPSLWNELRRLRPMRVGVFAVRRGAYPPAKCDGTFDVLKPGSGWKYREHMIERPTYDATSGRFTGFEAGWCDPDAWNWNKQGRRDFCVDMGGFAFDARLLHALDEGPIWNYTGHGGESELVGRLLCSDAPEDLQPLANCGQDVLVFHNEYAISTPSPLYRFCITSVSPPSSPSPPSRANSSSSPFRLGNRPSIASTPSPSYRHLHRHLPSRPPLASRLACPAGTASSPSPCAGRASRAASMVGAWRTMRCGYTHAMRCCLFRPLFTPPLHTSSSRRPFAGSAQAGAAAMAVCL